MELELQELEDRRRCFGALMDKRFPGWDTAIIIDNVNQYYFTGTMQDGLLFIFKDRSCLFCVRRSYERARQESPLGENEIARIASYRDIVDLKGADLGNVCLEGETMPLMTFDRLKKYFSMKSVNYLDSAVLTLRSVKSAYELHWTMVSGERHRILLEERVPALLREGMSEAELSAGIQQEMYKLGFQGRARFHRFQTELVIGQIGIGTNALFPCSFDGPGGTRGGCAAVPFSADETRKLKKGDSVFVDLAFGINGYHSDKTLVFMFGAEPPREYAAAHKLCMDIQKRIAERLRPGEIPSVIYQDIMASLSEEELDCFMGVDNKHRVKFLGHGVGLTIDEFPVIAKGFDDPLEEKMVLALEPKKGVPGIGMAGVEDTYIVKEGGGQCITGGGRDIIVV
jgi:Xaa-Pro aminopeptidase